MTVTDECAVPVVDGVPIYVLATKVVEASKVTATSRAEKRAKGVAFRRARREFVHAARVLMAAGMTYSQLARATEVPRQSLYAWFDAVQAAEEEAAE